VLTFEYGLFSFGVEFADDAEQALTAVGEQLKRCPDGVAVEIAGHTDDLPVPEGRRYRNNYALGMARAVAVAEVLREKAGLPSNLLSVRSLGESDAPYPNDSPENRARNRTVVIRVIPNDR